MNDVEFERISELVNNPKCFENYKNSEELIQKFKTMDIKSCVWKYSTIDNSHTLWYNPTFQLYFIDDRISNSILELHMLEDTLSNDAMMILRFDDIIRGIEGE